MAEDTKKTLQTQFWNIANFLCVLDRKIDTTIRTLVTLSSIFRTRMHPLMTAQNSGEGTFTAKNM